MCYVRCFSGKVRMDFTMRTNTRTDVVKIYRKFRDNQTKEIAELKRDVRDLRMLIGLITAELWKDEE